MKPGPPGPCPTVEDDDEVDCWVQAAARSVDLEAEAVEIPVCDVEAFLRQAGPALFVLRENTYPGVLALVRGGRCWVHLVGPDARVRRVKRDEVSDILRRTLEAPLMAEVDDLLEACKRYRDKDDRVQIQEYEDLVYPQLTVHAFYVKYLLPIYFDVQSMERS